MAVDFEIIDRLEDLLSLARRGELSGMLVFGMVNYPDEIHIKRISIGIGNYESKLLLPEILKECDEMVYERGEYSQTTGAA